MDGVQVQVSAEIRCKTIFDTREPMQNHNKYERHYDTILRVKSEERKY